MAEYAVADVVTAAATFFVMFEDDEQEEQRFLININKHNSFGTPVGLLFVTMCNLCSAIVSNDASDLSY